MNCIAVIAENRALGNEGRLLFSLPGDMKYFREHTRGRTVIMGRKTLDSFPGQKPLPKRTNIVLSRDESYRPEGVAVCRNREEVLELTAGLDPDDVWVIGGGMIYRLFLDDCRRVYLTETDGIAEEADSFFPELSPEDGWRLVSSSEEHEENGIRYRFCVYEKDQEDKDEQSICH